MQPLFLILMYLLRIPLLRLERKLLVGIALNDDILALLAKVEASGQIGSGIDNHKHRVVFETADWNLHAIALHDFIIQKAVVYIDLYRVAHKTALQLYSIRLLILFHRHSLEAHIHKDEHNAKHGNSHESDAPHKRTVNF